MCTDTELAQGQGCDAGWWPEGDGTCRPAGVFGALEATPTDALATSWGQPAGVPESTPLPSLQQTSFCLDAKTRQTVICDGKTPSPCPAGTMPDPSPRQDGQPPVCLKVGVDWTCPPGFVAKGEVSKVTGLDSCVADPADCGDDAFGGVAEAANVRFVDANAGGNGDGSRAKPFATINEAIAAVPVGGTVAVAAGTYAEQAVVDKAMHLRGRCAAMVHVKGPVGKVGIRVLGAGAGESVVSGFHIIAGSQGVQAAASRKTMLRRVWVSKIPMAGVLVSNEGVRVTLEESYIEHSEGGTGISPRPPLISTMPSR